MENLNKKIRNQNQIYDKLYSWMDNIIDIELGRKLDSKLFDPNFHHRIRILLHIQLETEIKHEKPR